MKILSLLFLMFISSGLFAQRNDLPFGISFGATLGTYAGADFGSAYYMSFYNSDYYDDYYRNNGYYYNNNYNNSFLSPLEFDLGMDFRVTDNLSLNFESSFIWHINGKPHRDYMTVITSQRSYIEKWENSYMYAVPMFLNLKVYPFGRQNYSMYISGGYGLQYTTESMDRVREDINYGYNYHGYRSYVYGVSDAKWLQGIKLAVGMSFAVSNNLSNETEIKVTNFFPQRNAFSPLAMNTSTNITFIGITSKMYINF